MLGNYIELSGETGAEIKGKCDGMPSWIRTLKYIFQG